MGGAKANGNSPVLYVLHGLSDDESIWIRRTSIERYVAAADLSGVTDIVRTYEDTKKGPYDSVMTSDEIESILGTLTDIEGSKHDLFHLTKELSQKRCEKPRIYQCCGTEDFLYQDNVKFREFIKKLDYDYIYEEESGIHECGFWDRKIQDALNWLQV